MASMPTSFPNTLTPISTNFNVGNASISFGRVFPPPPSPPPTPPPFVSPIRLDTSQGGRATIPVTSNVQVFLNAGPTGGFGGIQGRF
jgi:hypothetical protein